MNSRPPEGPPRWLLLIHQLPPKPAYPRVKIWRRLQSLGAVMLKNAVYALPAGDQTQEDFQWILKEIAEAGGDGLVCEARFMDGLSDQDIRNLFNAARDADYHDIAKAARALNAALPEEPDAGAQADTRARLARLNADAARVAGIDFFGASGRETVEGLLHALADRLGEKGEAKEMGTKAVAADSNSWKGRVWVTREGVHVDRIASAWLIRRFIDSEARFKFAPARGYTPKPGELRFDMFDGEFTHEGDRCTFEVLLARANLRAPALTAIGEIVHDIDLKDAKYGREETSGIARLIEGIVTANKDDVRRLERGAAMLDDLYEVYRRQKPQR